MGHPADRHARLAAFGNELIEIHRWLRADLARLHEDVDAYLEGRGGRPRELKTHCLTFCSALTRHHSAEDDTAFPTLAERYPDLRPVIEKLEEDHRLISSIVLRLERLIDAVPEQPDEAEARRVRSELDGLSAIMQSHFNFEERRIVAALNELAGSGISTEDLFGFGAKGPSGAA